MFNDKKIGSLAPHPPWSPTLGEQRQRDRALHRAYGGYEDVIAQWVHFLWPNPTHYKWKSLDPTQPNITNNGAYSLVVMYFYTKNFSCTFSQPSTGTKHIIALSNDICVHFALLFHQIQVIQWFMYAFGSTSPPRVLTDPSSVYLAGRLNTNQSLGVVWQQMAKQLSKFARMNDIQLASYRSNMMPHTWHG